MWRNNLVANEMTMMRSMHYYYVQKKYVWQAVLCHVCWCNVWVYVGSLVHWFTGSLILCFANKRTHQTKNCTGCSACNMAILPTNFIIIQAEQKRGRRASVQAMVQIQEPKRKDLAVLPPCLSPHPLSLCTYVLLLSPQLTSPTTTLHAWEREHLPGLWERPHRRVDGSFSTEQRTVRMMNHD